MKRYLHKLNVGLITPFSLALRWVKMVYVRATGGLILTFYHYGSDKPP